MDEGLFKCTANGCLKMYSNSFNLKRHVESFHQGIKKFFCDLCSKGLSSKQNLREHNNIHLGIKPYICKYRGCTEAFRQASQLILHQNFHAQVQRCLHAGKTLFSSDITYLTKIISVNVHTSTNEIADFSTEIEKVDLPPIRFKCNYQNSD